MPAVFAVVVGGVGAVVFGRWLFQEAKRINAVLHPEEPPPGSPSESNGQRLRRDPEGVYRPE